jgi:hypothetical protein
MTVELAAGVATGIGSLPHTDASAAADLVLERLPQLPFVPSLPRRSPAERMLALGLVGVPGVRIDADGDVSLDLARLDPLAEVRVDLGHEAFTGLRAFLAAARGRTGPVKWQVCGPVTLGLALMRRGAPSALAFDVAVRAVREHVATVRAAIADALPGARQVVFVDEPAFVGVMAPCFPVAPDVAIDLVSGALAAAEPDATTGVHCCGEGDWAALSAAGPGILAFPVMPSLVGVAGLIAGFLEHGGWVAWGAVPTDRPVGSSVDRWWRELAGLWCLLVQAGVDASLLRRQALLTPACGLALHDEAQASLVLDLVDELADRVHGQAVATRLTVGA